MNYDNILITGGAGFVGSNVAIALKRDFPHISVIAVDNLKRRGSEYAPARLAQNGIEFQHGDIRNPEDIKEAGPFDLIIECSAEASVHAGYNSAPSYLINTNLSGTVHCLDAARHHGADIMFLSTSRVYPIGQLRKLPMEVNGERFKISNEKYGPGWSPSGISEQFSMDGSRSLYGATKLSSELLLTEYNAMYGLRSIVNRCGVITGPWQLGVVDQGFVSLWAARHLFKGKLSYIGFGGKGCQVRDILHVSDLYTLIRCQLENLDNLSGQTFNVGGGEALSVSLAELTRLCQKRSGHTIELSCDTQTRDADVPWYITDISKINNLTGWKPEHNLDSILDDIFDWLNDNRKILKSFFSP